jgi:cell division protease FtsH
VNSTVKTIIFWVFIFACLVLLWQVFQKSGGMGKDAEIPYSQFLQDAQAGQIKDVTLVENEIHGHMKADNAQFHTVAPANDPELYTALREGKVSMTVKPNSGNGWLNILIQFSPVIIIGALWFFMLRQMQSGGNKAMSFGKSRARLLSMQQKKVTFKVRTSSRCSSASAQAAFATCLNKAKRTLPASSSSMKSTRSVAIAAQASAVDMMSASRP